MRPSAYSYLNPLFLCMIFLPARCKGYEERNIDSVAHKTEYCFVLRMMPPSGNKEVVNKICQINEQMYEMFICSANLESQNIQAVYIKNKRMQNSQ